MLVGRGCVKDNGRIIFLQLMLMCGEFVYYVVFENPILTKTAFKIRVDGPNSL